MSKIKNITLGIVIGLSIASTHTFAQDIKEYILSKVKYPIMVNGSEYVNEELPVLNYNNSTYIPLRAVGDILDAEVNWNNELKRVEIGEVIEEIKVIEKGDSHNLIKSFYGEPLEYSNIILSKSKLIPTLNDYIDVDGKRYYNYYFLTTKLNEYSSNIKSTNYHNDTVYEIYQNNNDIKNTLGFVYLSNVLQFNSSVYIHSEIIDKILSK
jgi:hypothetical protein